MDKNELAHRFQHHPPKDTVTTYAHQDTREQFLNLALEMDLVLPESREKALVMTKLEEGLMWANAAIARNGGPK